MATDENRPTPGSTFHQLNDAGAKSARDGGDLFLSLKDLSSDALYAWGTARSTNDVWKMQSDFMMRWAQMVSSYGSLMFFGPMVAFAGCRPPQE